MFFCAFLRDYGDFCIIMRMSKSCVRVLFLFFSLFLSMLVLLLFLVVRVSQTGEILVLVSFPGRFYVSLVDSTRDGDFAVNFFRGFDG